MKPTLLHHMFETIANVQMVKESTGDIQRMLDLTELSGGELPFYNGSQPAGARGADGGRQRLVHGGPVLAARADDRAV